MHVGEGTLLAADECPTVHQHSSDQGPDVEVPRIQTRECDVLAGQRSTGSSEVLFARTCGKGRALINSF
jgi:hypothetical protein